MTIHFIVFHVIKLGDVIQFVQYLFNLSFKEAMQKINEDFNLGLECNAKIDYKKIKQLENQRRNKLLKKNKLQKCYNQLCKEKEKYYKNIELLNKDLVYNNWEEIVSNISTFQIKCELIDIKLDEIDELISSS